ncbi:MAG: protein kinase [Anaerolineae bacterium]|nr:protein kinase [Anaerolineae bacterium]MDX9831160.1 protein kinase [Anaerolineae bacterium]
MANCPQCGAPVKPGARFCTRCGVRLAAAGLADAALTKTLDVGTPLQGGRYQIIGQLGHGGMGAVYLARDMELFGRLCVVKQMRPFFASQTERRRAEEDFKREAEVLARLNQPGHPRIPEVYGYFVEGLDQFLVMKYIEGESLERRLERLNDPLSETEVVRCGQEVANALVYLHSRKPRPVIHRDIKPANIIVDPEDRVWLVDFGLARAAVSSGARVMVAGGKTVAAGTPGYTPLEQWQMQPTVKSDVYALGATMHHLLTASDPRDRFTSFPELDYEILRSFSTFAPLSEVRPDVSPALAALVARCLDPDPKFRPTADQLEIELGALAPTGSRFFDTVKRWSPTLGEMLGSALASFVRVLFGRPAPRSRSGQRTPTPTVEQERPAIPCLYCRGQGTTRGGRTCPICRGTGYW